MPRTNIRAMTAVFCVSCLGAANAQDGPPTAAVRVGLVEMRPVEQRASVTGRQNPGGNAALNSRRQFEQADGVGDLRTRPADPLRQFLMRAAEIVEQLLVVTDSGIDEDDACYF